MSYFSTKPDDELAFVGGISRSNLTSELYGVLHLSLTPHWCNLQWCKLTCHTPSLFFIFIIPEWVSKLDGAWCATLTLPKQDNRARPKNRTEYWLPLCVLRTHNAGKSEGLRGDLIIVVKIVVLFCVTFFFLLGHNLSKVTFSLHLI